MLAGYIEKKPAGGCPSGLSHIDYPCAAYALGGLGSGFCDNEEKNLTKVGRRHSRFSPQVLVEKSFWKDGKSLNTKWFATGMTTVSRCAIWKIF